MNQKQLSYFLEVYKYRNIQVVADNLYISRQGLSKMIRSLEEELNKPLFTRTKEGLIPTDSAIILVPHVQKILEEYAFIQRNNTLSSGEKKIVTIYSLDGILSYLSLDFVQDFHTAYPNIILNIVDTTDGMALEKLRTRKCDFAMVPGPLDLTTFRGEKLFFSRYCALINKENPLAQNTQIRYNDLHNQNFAGKGREYLCYQNNVNSILQSGVQINIVMEVSSEPMLYEIVDKNMAIAITYDFMAMDHITPNMVMLPINDKNNGKDIYLVEYIESTQKLEDRIFKEFLIKWLSEHNKLEVKWRH